MNLLSKDTKAITMRFYDLFSMHILKEAQYNVYFILITLNKATANIKLNTDLENLQVEWLSLVSTLQPTTFRRKMLNLAHLSRSIVSKKSARHLF